MAEVKKQTPKKPAPKKPKLDYCELYREMENEVLTVAVKFGYLSDSKGMTDERKRKVIDYILLNKVAEMVKQS